MNGDESSNFKDPLLAQKDPAFYTDAAAYWEKVPATVNGVLGGFECVSDVDIYGSEKFLKSTLNMNKGPGNGRAIDCGAGIGRITENLLQKHFTKVDLIEQCSQFLDKAKQNLKCSKRVDNFYCMGLQDFTPIPNNYDVIWCQWVLGHLTDDDLEAFFKRLIPGLKSNGVIVVKENLSEEVELDETDSSVTRPQSLLLDIIERAGLYVLRNVKQQKFPKSLLEVRMFLLKPRIK